MTNTLSIRLDPEDRATLEEAARSQGKGLSAFVRELAESEATRVRRQEIRADGERVVAYLATNPAAADELDDFGTPMTDRP